MTKVAETGSYSLCETKVSLDAMITPYLFKFRIKIVPILTQINF